MCGASWPRPVIGSGNCAAFPICSSTTGPSCRHALHGCCTWHETCRRCWPICAIEPEPVLPHLLFRRFHTHGRRGPHVLSIGPAPRGFPLCIWQLPNPARSLLGPGRPMPARLTDDTGTPPRVDAVGTLDRCSGYAAPVATRCVGYETSTELTDAVGTSPKASFRTTPKGTAARSSDLVYFFHRPGCAFSSIGAGFSQVTGQPSSL